MTLRKKFNQVGDAGESGDSNGDTPDAGSAAGSSDGAGGVCKLDKELLLNIGLFQVTTCSGTVV